MSYRKARRVGWQLKGNRALFCVWTLISWIRAGFTPNMQLLLTFFYNTENLVSENPQEKINSATLSEITQTGSPHPGPTDKELRKGCSSAIFSLLFRCCTSQFSLGLTLVAQSCDLSLFTNLGRRKKKKKKSLLG